MQNEAPLNYSCVKCGGSRFDVKEMRATGGMLSQIFDVQNRRYTTVTCCQCGYTELFAKESNDLLNIFDIFTS